MKLTRVEAIRMIRRWTIGLPRAIEIYNYLTCYGELEITTNDIRAFFEN